MPIVFKGEISLKQWVSRRTRYRVPWQVHQIQTEDKSTQQTGDDQTAYPQHPDVPPVPCRRETTEKRRARREGEHDGHEGVDGDDLAEFGEELDGGAGEWYGGDEGGYSTAQDAHAYSGQGLFGAPLTHCCVAL